MPTSVYCKNAVKKKVGSVNKCLCKTLLLTKIDTAHLRDLNIFLHNVITV